MELDTVGDALTALSGLLGDIANAQSQVINVNSSWWSEVTGASSVATSATSLLTGLTNYATEISGELEGLSSDTPLTIVQTNQLKELQKEVISDRSLISQQISSVDWTFGSTLGDAATIIENWSSQAVTGLSNAVGINWTAVSIVIIVIFGLLFWSKIKEVI